MDSILFWNDVALEANRVAHTKAVDHGTLGPTLSARALAMVHLAMYDAYVGVLGSGTTLPVYQTGLPTPGAGAKVDAAISGAAHWMLSNLYMSMAGDFSPKLITASNDYGFAASSNDPGVAFGIEVAKRLFLDRSLDPSASSVGYNPPTNRGAHQPDPDSPTQSYYGPFCGQSKCFSVGVRYALDAPPAVNTTDYKAALQFVRGKGIAPELVGTAPTIHRRTEDETLMGIYWGYDGAKQLGTPPRLYNQIVRTLAIDRGNNLEKNVHLFALVNVAMADAGILAWEQKYVHNLHRPVVGIRQYDQSMGAVMQTSTGTVTTPTTANNNIDNDCDVNWLPLGAPNSNNPGSKNGTPPFPAYPSGHATFGAAALHITRRFYGITGTGNDNLFNGLSFVSEEFDGKTTDNKGTTRPRHVRSFPGGLWQMIMENGFSRVYIGVHWHFDAFALNASLTTPDVSQNIGGVPLGLNIANDIWDNNMPKSTV
jgi:hypothetical protein